MYPPPPLPPRVPAFCLHGWKPRLDDQVEQKLISAGLLRQDGVELEEDEARAGGGVFNEVEVSDGEEACEILMERLGFDEVSFFHLPLQRPEALTRLIDSPVFSCSVALFLERAGAYLAKWRLPAGRMRARSW